MDDEESWLYGDPPQENEDSASPKGESKEVEELVKTSLT